MRAQAAEYAASEMMRLQLSDMMPGHWRLVHHPDCLAPFSSGRWIAPEGHSKLLELMTTAFSKFRTKSEHIGGA